MPTGVCRANSLGRNAFPAISRYCRAEGACGPNGLAVQSCEQSGFGSTRRAPKGRRIWKVCSNTPSSKGSADIESLFQHAELQGVGGFRKFVLTYQVSRGRRIHKVWSNTPGSKGSADLESSLKHELPGPSGYRKCALGTKTSGVGSGKIGRTPHAP